jgi:hypothetical protein
LCSLKALCILGLSTRNPDSHAADERCIPFRAAPSPCLKAAAEAGDYPRELWDHLEAYFTTIEPRTTDTAIMEFALKEYLDRHDYAAKDK